MAVYLIAVPSQRGVCGTHSRPLVHPIRTTRVAPPRRFHRALRANPSSHVGCRALCLVCKGHGGAAANADGAHSHRRARGFGLSGTPHGTAAMRELFHFCADERSLPGRTAAVAPRKRRQCATPVNAAQTPSVRDTASHQCVGQKQAQQAQQAGLTPGSSAE